MLASLAPKIRPQPNLSIRRMHISLYPQMNRYCVCLIAATLVGCGDRTPSPASRTPVVRQQAVTTDTVRADSARAFVQRFYVWYLAIEAQKGSPYDSLLTT